MCSNSASSHESVNEPIAMHTVCVAVKWECFKTGEMKYDIKNCMYVKFIVHECTVFTDL